MGQCSACNEWNTIVEEVIQKEVAREWKQSNAAKTISKPLKIEEIHNGDLNEFTFFGPFSQAYLEAAAPDYKFGLNAQYSINKLDMSWSIFLYAI